MCFLKNRIVLTEKIRSNNRFVTLIEKKYWVRTELDEMEGIYFFIFRHVEFDFVTMSNSTEILIPFFERG